MAKTPTKIEVSRLQQALNYSYRQLKPVRENSMRAMQQYVTSHYSETGADRKVPFSLLELAVTTYTQRLTGGRPQALFTTRHQQLQPQKAKLQRETNHLLSEIRLQDTFTEIVQGAFFSMGIAKTALGLAGKTEYNGFLQDITQAFCNAVTIDNWVHDITAQRWDKVQFCGDRSTMDLEDARDRFDDAKGAKVKPLRDQALSGERTSELSDGKGWNREYYRDITEIWEIWDPRKDRVIVLAAGDGSGPECDISGEYLDVVDWNGPEAGPYRLLRFNPVQGNVMPVPPVSLWIDLHDLANNVMRKLERQAQRQKTITGVRPGGDQDAKRTIDANDGDMIPLIDPKNIANLNFPGVEPQLLAFLIQIKNLASWLWGNIDALGGLSPQSDTLGQDRLLSATASQRLVKMQNTVLDFATDVIHDLAQHLYTDQTRIYPQAKQYGDIVVPTYWTPADREGDFLEYNMTIEPYSLHHRTPDERLETIRQVMIQLVFPYSQVLATQGVIVDYETLFKLVSEYAGLPEINDILTYANPHITEEGPVGGGRALQSPVTSRTNTRINRPGATSQGKDEAMIGQLLGIGQQASQVAQIARPTG